MKLLNNLTIKSKLYLVCFLVAISFLILLFVVLLSNTKTKHLTEFKSSIHAIETIILKLRKDEKDFLMREKLNEAYFESGNSKYLTSFSAKSKQLDSIILHIETNTILNTYNLQNKIDSLNFLVKEYHKNFRGWKQHRADIEHKFNRGKLI